MSAEIVSAVLLAIGALCFVAGAFINLYLLVKGIL